MQREGVQNRTGCVWGFFSKLLLEHWMSFTCYKFDLHVYSKYLEVKYRN